MRSFLCPNAKLIQQEVSFLNLARIIFNVWAKYLIDLRGLDLELIGLINKMGF